MAKPSVELLAFHILYQEREIEAMLDAVGTREKVEKKKL